MRADILGALLLSLFCLQCDGPSDAQPHHHEHESNGDGELMGESFVVGLEKPGDHGRFTVRLMESDPIPRYTGLYSWTLEIVDAEGRPLSGASVRAEPRMPDHDHGTFPRVTDATTMGEPGRYVLAEMDLFMDGVWRVEIEITDTDGEVDLVRYHFDLEG